jgi:hypothetical protein
MPVKQEPVIIKWQIIFTFIPFLNLYAFYKIQKLRLFLCFFMPISIASRIIGAAPSTYEGAIIHTILFSGLSIGLSIWFVLKWSKQWNEKFS